MPDSAPPSDGPDGAAPSPIPMLSGRRILVAEDSPANRAMIEALLAPTEARVELVGDGKAVVAAHAREPAELILMDIGLPLLDGIEATRRIRQQGAGVPIVALSGYARPSDEQRGLEAGVTAYIVKPFDIDRFYEVVAEQLSGAADRGNG